VPRARNPNQEIIMHPMTCNCSKCKAAQGAAFEVEPFRFEVGGAVGGPERLLSEMLETELAMELLSVSNEEEWEQFLGKLVRSVGKGLKKVGSFVGKRILPKLGGVLKSVAKTALPFVGGALGSLIPVPGVGTALGRALGSAVGNALEMEYGGAGGQEAEFEMARRFVRIAASATQRAAQPQAGVAPDQVVRDAVLAAARSHLPGLKLGPLAAEGGARGAAPASGRWIRQGRSFIVLGV
jgi:hypothetical protein